MSLLSGLNPSKWIISLPSLNAFNKCVVEWNARCCYSTHSINIIIIIIIIVWSEYMINKCCICGARTLACCNRVRWLNAWIAGNTRICWGQFCDVHPSIYVYEPIMFGPLEYTLLLCPCLRFYLYTQPYQWCAMRHCTCTPKRQSEGLVERNRWIQMQTIHRMGEHKWLE